MPRRKRCASSSFDDYDDEYDDELSSNGSRHHQQPPIQRNAANARERARMRVLSSAFCRLKTKLPWVPADTKLSKLDTLRLATIYIQQLRASLSKEETDDEIFCQANAQSLVWPFSFQQHIDNKQIATVSLNQWLSRGYSNSNDIYLHTQSSTTKNINNFMNNNSSTHA